MSNLILTCTIDTGNCPGVIRNNPVIREKDYFEAITKYLETTDLFLIVVENSGFDFTSWKNTWKGYSDRMEFVSVPTNAGEFVGKGNGEVHSILYVLKNSKYFSHKENIQGNFYKVSGRYYSPDIHNIISTYDKEHCLIVRDFQPNGNILTVFFGIDALFFIDYFESISDVNDSGKIFESHMGDIARGWAIFQDSIKHIGPMNFVDAICSNGVPFIDY